MQDFTQTPFYAVGKEPVNIKLLAVTDQLTTQLRPVTSLDIFDGATRDFHPDGLFSVEIFGRLGSEERDMTFGYIDIKLPIFHPFVYLQLCNLKGLYQGIMSGRAYAIWDDKIKDFMPSDIVNGNTGYMFFMTHWKNIIFRETGSDIRKLRIEFIEKYRGIATTSKVMVLPAGLRDFQADETGGRDKEGEVNTFYRRLLGVANTIGDSGLEASSYHDTARMAMQTAFNNIYDYFSTLLQGKNGLLLGSFGSRRVFNGTRNVITGMDTGVKDLDNPYYQGINDTGLGLYQLMRAVTPHTKNIILNGWMSNVFLNMEGDVQVVDPKSLKSVKTTVPTKLVDRWKTPTGLEKVINSFAYPDNRDRPVMLGDYYVGLIYKGPDKTFKVFGDIDELPEHLDRKYVSPISLSELLYIDGLSKWNKFPLDVTRYPVAGDGSIYPSFAYLRTTVKAEQRKQLGDDWQITEVVAGEFPIKGQQYVDSTILHPSRLAGLGGDYDGDTVSVNALYTEEAIQETIDYLNSPAAYVNPRGGFKNSPITETVERVIFNLTFAATGA